MIFLNVILFVLLSIFILYLLFFPAAVPNVPGPSFYDYLPGGLANLIYTNPTKVGSYVFPSLVKKYGNILQVRIGFKPCVILTNPADISHVSTGSLDFGRPRRMKVTFNAILPDSIFTMPHEEHLKARRVLRANFNHTLLPHFHTAMVDAISEVLGELHKTLTDAADLSPPKIVDIFEHVTTITMRVVLNVAFGMEFSLDERMEMVQRLNLLNDEMLLEYFGYPVRQALTFTGLRSKMFGCNKVLRERVRDLLQKRVAESKKEKATRNPDLMDAILSLEAHDAERCISEFMAFMLAGTHTQALALSFSFLHLCKDERVCNKLVQEVDEVMQGRDPNERMTRDDYEELHYARKVWKETLRLSTSALSIVRTTLRDVKLKGTGVTMPKGTDLMCSMHLVQNDSQYWDEPNAFIPERWGSPGEPGDADVLPPGTYMPYGLGQRSCAGQFLAEYQGPLILAEMFRAYRFELACPPEEVKSVTGLLEMPRWSSKNDGVYDMGVPVVVRSR